MMLLLLPFFFPRFFLAGKWTVRKEIIMNACFFIIHTTGYLVYTKLSGFVDNSLYILFRVLLVSGTIIVILFVINQDRLLRVHLKSALELIKGKDKELPPLTENIMFSFPAETKSDPLTIPIHSLLFIKSADNYVEVVWQDDQNWKKKLVRTTLHETEAALERFPFIIKCHRTCLINIHNMDHMKETPNGLMILQSGLNEVIPVSKQYVNKIRSIMNKS
jgi:hypothetical protein